MFPAGQGSPLRWAERLLFTAPSLLLAVSGGNQRARGGGLPRPGLWGPSSARHDSPAAERAAPQHGEAPSFLVAGERD